MRGLVALLQARVAFGALSDLYGPRFNLSFAWTYDETPDCVSRQPLVTVNGLWPPPTLHVRAGDEVTLQATNHLVAVAFTIHIHGFDQVGTPWDDGVGLVATCPIVPETSGSVQWFFAPEAPGTYMYHGHVAHAKVAGFTGLLVVEPNPDLGIDWPATWGPRHDAELDVLLQDGWHAPTLPAMAGLLQKDYRWVGDPQTLLINGAGHFDCDDNLIYSCEDESADCDFLGGDRDTCGAGNTIYYNAVAHCDESLCPPQARLDAEPGRTYLLRVANGGVSSLVNLAIEDHVMIVVSLDGSGDVEPVAVDSMDLGVGQRFSARLARAAGSRPACASNADCAGADVCYEAFANAYLEDGGACGGAAGGCH